MKGIFELHIYIYFSRLAKKKKTRKRKGGNNEAYIFSQQHYLFPLHCPRSKEEKGWKIFWKKSEKASEKKKELKHRNIIIKEMYAGVIPAQNRAQKYYYQIKYSSNLNIFQCSVSSKVSQWMRLKFNLGFSKSLFSGPRRSPDTKTVFFLI